MLVGVAVGILVSVGVGVSVDVSVAVGVLVGVAVGTLLPIGVGVRVDTSVAVGVPVENGVWPRITSGAYRVSSASVAAVETGAAPCGARASSVKTSPRTTTVLTANRWVRLAAIALEGLVIFSSRAGPAAPAPAR